MYTETQILAPSFAEIIRCIDQLELGIDIEMDWDSEIGQVNEDYEIELDCAWIDFKVSAKGESWVSRPGSYFEQEEISCWMSPTEIYDIVISDKEGEEVNLTDDEYHKIEIKLKSIITIR